MSRPHDHGVEAEDSRLLRQLLVETFADELPSTDVWRRIQSRCATGQLGKTLSPSAQLARLWAMLPMLAGQAGRIVAGVALMLAIGMLVEPQTVYTPGVTRFVEPRRQAERGRAVGNTIASGDARSNLNEERLSSLTLAQPEPLQARYRTQIPTFDDQAAAQRREVLPTPRALSQRYLLRLQASLMSDTPTALSQSYLRRIGQAVEGG